MGDSQILTIAMGLQRDQELANLNIEAHSMEDYLIKTMLLDQTLQRRAAAPLRECAAKLSDVLKDCGVQPLSSKLLYQVLKPILGLPAHDSGDTGSVAKLGRAASTQVITQMTASLNQKLDEFRKSPAN